MVYSILFDSKKGIGNDIRVRDGANTVDSTQSHFHIEQGLSAASSTGS